MIELEIKSPAAEEEVIFDGEDKYIVRYFEKNDDARAELRNVTDMTDISVYEC